MLARSRACYFAILLLLSVGLTGCAELFVAALACDITTCRGTAEENFRSIISSDVGKAISSVRYSAEQIREIDGETSEYEYECCARGCRYYYLVNVKTGVIQSWRYEGPCAIPP